MFQEPLTPNKFLNDAEFAALNQNLARWYSNNSRDVTIFQLLLATGARPTEVLNLTPKDVIHDYKAVAFKGLKGSNSRTIPLSDELWNKLLKFTSQDSAKAKDKIFPITYNRLGQIWREYRPSNKSLRSTRHTFAVRLYRKCKDLRLVQKTLGHKSISTTEIYMDFVHNMEEFRKALF
jgi:integrase/recombinase XerD